MTAKDHHSNSIEFYIQHDRPEEWARNPLDFYTKERVKEYAESKSLMRTQVKITERVMNLAQISPPALILDLGMGCGFASTHLQFQGYRTIGLDLNHMFLNYYDIPNLNPIHADMRHFHFKPHTFDLIISISAIQWVLAERKYKKRHRFIKEIFTACNACLKPNGKIIMQFYPKSDESMKEFGGVISDLGFFTGNFIVDNAHSPKKRKIYLYLEKTE